jgi:hypothetical protein
METNQPTTLVTDLALAGVAAACAAALVRRAGPSGATGRAPVLLWACGLGALALGAAAGGVWHGFVEDLPAPALTALWTVVQWATGLASLLLLSACLRAAVAPPLRTALVALAGVKFAGFAVAQFGRDDFLLVVLDYGSGLVAVAAVCVWTWFRRRAPSAPWILAGIAVSAVAVAVQRGRLVLHPRFDENDLFHVVQAGGLLLLYRGGSLLGHGAGAEPAGPSPVHEA